MKSKFDIGTCVFYKDRIYEISYISNDENNFKYTLTGMSYSFDVENEDELTPTKNDKKNFKIGDLVKYYSQDDDLIHEGVISGFDPDNIYVYFNDKKGTYIDYLGIENRKLRKFDIDQIIFLNEKQYKINDYFFNEGEYYYCLDNFNESIKESMLSPII